MNQAPNKEILHSAMYDIEYWFLVLNLPQTSRYCYLEPDVEAVPLIPCIFHWVRSPLCCEALRLSIKSLGDVCGWPRRSPACTLVLLSVCPISSSWSDLKCIANNKWSCNSSWPTTYLWSQAHNILNYSLSPHISLSRRRTAASHQQVDLGLEIVYIVIVWTLVRGLSCELFDTQLQHLLPANPQ